MDLKILTVVVVLVAVTSCSAMKSIIKKDFALRFQPFHRGNKPKFCNGLDCPEFKILKKFKDYELREYAQSDWVTTSMTGINWNEASTKMFMKLYRYIQGENNKKAEVNMTAPVITRIIPGQGPTCENNFTMSFYVAKHPAPLPTSKDLTFTSLPKQRVFVRTFGGWAFQDEWIANAAQLSKSIGNDKLYVDDYYYGAGYNSPFQIVNRHNEIWFISK